MPRTSIFEEAESGKGNGSFIKTFLEEEGQFLHGLVELCANGMPIASPKRTLKGMAWTEKEMEMGVAATQFNGAAVIDLFIGF